MVLIVRDYENKKTLSYIRRKFNRFWLKIKDPKRLIEISGKRVILENLKETDFFYDVQNKRILEIGPKHGKDSIILAGLKPRELVLIDLPSKRNSVNEWLPQISKMCKTTFIEGNILYLTQDQYKELGKFDIILCLGVLYHNVEQIRLLKRLYELCNLNGKILIESATTRNKKLQNYNIVEIHWPTTYKNTKTITHLPSRLAIKSWLEMVGFQSVLFRSIYSKNLSKARAIISAIKTEENLSYLSYDQSEKNPKYIIGNSS